MRWNKKCGEVGGQGEGAEKFQAPVLQVISITFMKIIFLSGENGVGPICYAVYCYALNMTTGRIPGETKPVMSKIGATKWIRQNEGKVTSEMNEDVVAAMWAAARGACDNTDILPSVL